MTGLSPNGAAFVGPTPCFKAEVFQWLSLADSDLRIALHGAILLLTGEQRYTQKRFRAAVTKLEPLVEYLESHLTTATFLVGERVTAADFFMVGILETGFRVLWGKYFIERHTAIFRWFTTMIAQVPFDEVFEQPFPFRKKRMEPVPRKIKLCADRSSKKKKPPNPRAAMWIFSRHPLARIPMTSLSLYRWRRVYYNQPTRDAALPWFWARFKPAEYSLWRVDYRYNAELGAAYRTRNLVQGIIYRLSESFSFMFGTFVVFGCDDDNGIVGVFAVKGQRHEPCFSVAPECDCFKYTRLDASIAKDKAFVEDVWAGDRPIEIDGEKWEINHMQVFR